MIYWFNPVDNRLKLGQVLRMESPRSLTQVPVGDSLNCLITYRGVGILGYDEVVQTLRRILISEKFKRPFYGHLCYGWYEKFSE